MQEPMQELEIGGKKVLLLHGTIDDPYWGKLTPAKVEDEKYQDFDYVLSGHIHQPFKIDVFFKVDNPIMRNQKRTTFINPGSVVETDYRMTLRNKLTRQFTTRHASNTTYYI